MRAKLEVVAWALVALVIVSGAAFGAQGPGKINYQGVLRDAAGTPRAGSFDMIFRFYDAPTGGAAILVDRHTAAGTGAVTVTTGLFSATLGGGDVSDGLGTGTYLSLSDVFTRHNAVYLEVTVSDETLSPRTQVLSSAFTIGNPGPDGPCFDQFIRFEDCGNGTVTDAVTGLIWAKNANCVGALNYVDANNQANELQAGQCGLSDGSARGAWRLPTLAEWQAIADPTCGAPALPDRVGLGCFSSVPWASGVQPFAYWSSSTYVNNPQEAHFVSLATGTTSVASKGGATAYAWPVRGGR